MKGRDRWHTVVAAMRAAGVILGGVLLLAVVLAGSPEGVEACRVLLVRVLSGW